jgi:transcriptional regulator with XRE-family HTH domain
MFWKHYVDLCNQTGEAPNTVAAKCGVKSTGTVTGWSNGAKPRPGVLKRIADYFGVSVAYLLGEEEKAPLINGDAELTDYLEELRTRPEMRMLFSAAQGATKEDIERAVKIIAALRGSGESVDA